MMFTYFLWFAAYVAVGFFVTKYYGIPKGRFEVEEDDEVSTYIEPSVFLLYLIVITFWPFVIISSALDYLWFFEDE